MKTNHPCRWVRPRLSLLAGGELGVEDRRKVERHLIGCPGCRDLREASTGALSALRAFAEEPPVRVDAPSLWPDLAVQIRESRHLASRPSWADLFLPRPWTALSLATGLVGAVAVILAWPTGREVGQAPAPIVVQMPRVELPVLALEPRKGALPTANSPGALPQTGGVLADPPSGFQINFDLDHGTPMGFNNRDPQHSY